MRARETLGGDRGGERDDWDVQVRWGGERERE